MLERLLQLAQQGSDDALFAERGLAELLLETEPWRAALHIRRLLAAAPEEDSNWALMGLAQAILGHHRYAVRAYQRALARDPGNPYYSHNLGHILDVALDRPVDAIALLARAHRRLPRSTAVTCSYVHALWRAGRLSLARRVLAPLLVRDGKDPDVCALAAQLEGEQTRTRRRSPAKQSPRTKSRAQRAR